MGLRPQDWQSKSFVNFSYPWQKEGQGNECPEKAGAYSCRHSISDVLKAALVPKELRDAMTGHVSSQDIAENTYGSVAAQLVVMNAARKDALMRDSANIVANRDPAGDMAFQTLRSSLRRLLESFPEMRVVDVSSSDRWLEHLTFG